MASRESSVPLIRTKLHRPSVPFDVVGRDRLFRLMDRAFEMPLTLVSAPAGYGKSVLVAQWAEHCEHPVAWLSLDEDESDLRLFLQYLVAAVHTVAEGACRATEELLQATELPPPSVLAGHLLNDFEALGQPLAIVLDDYHRIQISSPVHDLIGRLLEHPPSSVRLVLVTRRDPPLPFMSLLAGNQVAEVRLEDLRFTGGETAEFLSATAEAELAISDEALANLQQQVEGWAAGLRLVILALRHAVDPESLLGGLRGGLPQTRAYLLREALSGLSPEDRDWLLRSSILDRFCAPLLEAVCCPDGASAHPELTGRKFLDLIQRNNLFTIALDTEGEWFRYHHLFQDLLQRQLRETSSSEDIASLHLRAGEWFEAEGLIDEALKHALAAEQIELAAQLVERHRQAAVDADRWYALDKWLGSLPEPVVQQRAELQMARVWVLVHHSRFDHVYPILDSIEALLDDGPDSETLRGEVALFRGYILFFLGDGAGSLEFIEEALERIPLTCEEARAQSEVIFALSSQMEGRKELALRGLDDLLRLYRSPSDLRKTRLVVTCVMIHIISGDLTEAEIPNKYLRDIATAGGFAYAGAWSDYLQGLIHLHRWELEKATDYLSRSVAQRLIHFKRAAVDSFAALMLVHQARGRTDEAQATLQTLHEFADSLHDPAYPALADSVEARLALLQGRADAAEVWLESSPPPPDEAMLWWQEMPSVTRCRVLIAKGTTANLREAEKRLSELVALNEAHYNSTHLVEVLTLLATACEKQKKAEEALEYLERAVTLARPGGFIFPFIEAGPTMAGMLERLLESDEADFIRRVLSAFSKRPVAAPATAAPARETAPQPAAGSAAPEVLTNRELDVLELLAERLQNKEIASRLCVSTHTVNYHLKSVYAKLGVGNRRQAVSRAHEMGILKPTESPGRE